MVSKGSRRGPGAAALKQPPAAVIAGAIASGAAGAVDWWQWFGAGARTTGQRIVGSSAFRSAAVWLTVALISCVCWIVCETLVGIASLGLGLRLWTYEMWPVVWAVTSPVAWLVIFVGMTPFAVLLDKLEALTGLTGFRRVCARIAYLAILGPIIEVIMNELIFKKGFGAPLYTYDYLPTFDGSGSVLSPLYYLTLYIHFPVTALVFRRLRLRP